jgi:hypothetical protein
MMFDSDRKEFIELSNGDVIPYEEEESLLEAYAEGLLTKEQMINELGFDGDFDND